MQKKVYTKDLSRNEVFERLNKGKKIFNENNNDYYAMYNNAIAYYEDNVLVAFNATIYLNDPLYFLDEVKEPEADKSCIGKLCYFYNDVNHTKIVGILERIEMLEEIENLKSKKMYPYRSKNGDWYRHCQALTKEEVKAITKE